METPDLISILRDKSVRLTKSLLVRQELTMIEKDKNENRFFQSKYIGVQKSIAYTRIIFQQLIFSVTK